MPRGRNLGFLARERDYDRATLLNEAAQARARRRWRKAIRLYRWVLAVEPRNPDLHAKLAPLLARTGQPYDALVSFRAAARAHLREERPDRALAVYREAARCLPRETALWLELADLERRHGRRLQAVEALLQGRRRLRGRRRRAQAIHLLRCVRSIAPNHVVASLALARLLVRSDQRQEALLVLDDVATRCEGRELRKVRRARFRLTLALGDGWRWLRTGTARAQGNSAEASETP